MDVFILEDDDNWQLIYQETLGHLFQLHFFSTVFEFEQSLSQFQRAFVLIADLKLKDGFFLDFLKTHSYLPNLGKILVVSSHDELEILEECFEIGVADYLTKPFNSKELIVKRLLDPEQNSFFMGIKIDRLLHRISYNNNEVQLTPREFQILNFLIEKGNRGVHKMDLLQSIWRNTNVTSNTVEVHICNIRKKILPLGLEISIKSPNTFLLCLNKVNLTSTSDKDPKIEMLVQEKN